MNQPQVYYSQLYRNFRAIDAGEYRKRVHFYERHEKEIKQLDFLEYFELLVAYTNALFETAAYKKHILMADVVIEISFMENITEIGGQEVFHTTLFKKALSYYNLQDLTSAMYVLTELIKIDPNDFEATYFLERCLRKSRPQFIRNTRATAIGLFLATALIISIETLFVRNFSPEYMSLVEVIRNITFGLGFFILIGGELIHWLKAKRDVVRLVSSVKKVKIGQK